MTVRFELLLQRSAFRLEVAAELQAPITGLFGASGSGKSTLLHALAGLSQPSSGRLSIGSEVLYDSATGVDIPAEQRRIGLVFQDGRLFPHLSVADNLHYGEHLLPSEQRHIRFDDVVELLELSPLLARGTAALSGGERQRVALGRALLISPRLLLLDEPLAALDRRLRRRLLPYFLRVQQALEVPMLYVSHELSEVLQLSDRLLVLQQGSVLGHGRYHELALHGRLPSGNEDLVNVLPAVIAGRDAAAGMCRLRVGDVELLAPDRGGPEGSEAPVLLRPEDVAIATGPVEGISVQNQLPATLESLQRVDGRVLLRVDMGTPLLVEVTSRTVESLGLSAGSRVTCLIKSTALKPL